MKVTGSSHIIVLGISIERANLLHENTTSSISKLILYPKSESPYIPKLHLLVALYFQMTN